MDSQEQEIPPLTSRPPRSVWKNARGQIKSLIAGNRPKIDAEDWPRAKIKKEQEKQAGRMINFLIFPIQNQRVGDGERGGSSFGEQRIRFLYETQFDLLYRLLGRSGCRGYIHKDENLSHDCCLVNITV